jgi:hypothetical protein
MGTERGKKKESCIHENKGHLPLRGEIRSVYRDNCIKPNLLPNTKVKRVVKSDVGIASKGVWKSRRV